MYHRLIRFFTLAALLGLGAQTATAASSFIVNTTNDSGAGSLRQAINDANASAGEDNIYFLISSGSVVRTIAPATPLPAITDPVNISGYTQPGSSVNTLTNGNNAVLRVELNGSMAGGDVFGLYLATSDCTVRGLVINSFSGASLVLAGTGGHLVEGNFIGTDAAGVLSRTNSAGIYVAGSAQNTIGGTTPAARNLISGNTGAGINVEGVGASNNVITGNFIGIDFTGTNRLGNGTVGVEISDASGNFVGGINAGSRNVISGNTQDGIKLVAAHRNQIQGNYVGLGADGTTPVPNQQYGIYLVNSSLNRIGGTTVGARNVISANPSGCVIAGGSSNIIQGNYVGTDASGLLVRTNAVGIYLAGCPGNWIGGFAPGAGNLISGSEANVQIYGSNSSNNVVAGNLIGTDRTGLAGLGGGTAVEIADASRNRIGGSTPASRNVISGNREGVIIYEAGAVGNVVSGNLIGVGVNGVTPVGNLAYGVFVAASSNWIGGILAGEGNVIAHNGAGWPIWRAGVVIAEETSVGNSILGNSIFANDSVGIDLGGTFSLDSDGVTLNDLGDTDTGPNNRQNFPVLVSATRAGGTIVHGTLKSAANAIYRLEFFASPSADPSGYGEGQTFLGATNVTTDNVGQASFTALLPAAGAGSQVVSATATDPGGNTSEFSLAVPVGVAGDLDPGFNPNANNSVYSTMVQPDGKIVIGGNFTTVGGTARNGMARLNADGTLDPGFNPNVNNLVLSTVLQTDGKMVIGGGFSAVGGMSRSLIARLHRDGTLDSEFNVIVSGGATPSIQCMAMQADGKIVVGGVFTTVASTARNRIARFTADGSLDFGFNPDANERVYSVAVQPDGKIVIGGGFTAVGGTTRNYLARLNADGTLDAGFDPNANNIVYNIAVQADGKIVISGNFSTVGGTPHNYLARLNADGTVDPGFNPGPNSAVFSTALQADGSMVIGGAFTTLATTRNHVARLLGDGTLDNGFNPDANDSVYSTAIQADGQCVVGGQFTTVGGLARNRFARLLNGAATQTLTVPGATRVKWVRGGTAPETTQVTFELSTNGMTWTTLGSGTRLVGIGWELTGLSLPTNGTIRARARITGGYLHGSSGLVEQQATFSLVPEICVAPPSGLVAWWRAEDNALDAVGTNHGALVNGTSFTNGQVGRAFNLDGVNDYVSLPDGPTWDFGTNDFTIEMWVKLAGSQNTMFLSQQSGASYGGFEFHYQPGNTRLMFGLNSSDVADSGTWFAQTNVWYHLAVTRSNRFTRIYVDGTQIPNSGNFNAAPVANVSGIVRLGSYAAGGYDMAGLLDEVSVYHHSLSAAEIAALYLASSAGKCPPGLAGRPVVRVNGVYHPDNSAMATNSALIALGNTFIGGTIRYTLDGAPPAGGVLYTGPFLLTQPALVRAIAYAVDFSSSVESDAVLVDVVVPPFIITEPFGRTVGAGADVSLSVAAGGTAPLGYQWRRNGVAVPGATDAALLLSDIVPAQGGGYTVAISNAFGSVTSTVAQVVVFAPPSFLSQPESVTVSVGGTATFAVSALGPPPLEFQWRKNGANIAGATNSVLTIANVQFDDGASYSVVVASPGGTLVSEPALLIVTVPSPPAGDNFASTNTLLGASGSATGTNNFATREPGEPFHAGKPGSNSVWYSWTAPAKGIATFRTTGSTFDTLLGIYTGINVANLRTIVSDEDGGGFLASRASFNASNGVTYHIAIDGLNGQQGGYVLRWELVVTTDTVPEIICPPASLTVLPGQNATFTVSATGSSLAYQWLLNGTNIAGATNALYTRTNVHPEHVGFCNVRVTSASGQTVESAPALLEIGPDPGVQSRDKPDDVDAICPGNFRPAAGASSVAMGSVGYQVLVSSSTNNLIDCNTTNCGGIPTGTRYLELQPSASGTFLIDTVGSASRTKLWVCRAGTNNLDPTRTYLTCDVDSTPDGRSIVSFNAESGRTYQVWISKLDNTNGVLQLNWKLGLPPRIASLSSHRFVLEGTATILSVSATNIVASGVPATNALSAPIYTWYFNGPTPVATGPTLNLNNLQAGDAGQYLVVARNEVGTTSAVVRVEVFGPAGVAVVRSGGTTELFADATTVGCGAAPVRYQWRLNGASLNGQTNRSLFLTGTQPTQAGQYSVTVSNCFGATTYVAATVAVTVDVGFTAEIVGGQVVLRWQTTPGKRYRVEYRATPDGGSWLPLQPDLTAATSSLMVVDALGAMPRFYRIVLLD